MKVYIPENLNVDQLINENNPTEIANFERIKLFYIISLVTEIASNHPDLLDEFGFIPINAQILQRMVRNYKSYIEYLIRLRILEPNRNGQYITGKRSRSYRFCERYNTNVIELEIYDEKFSKKLNKPTKRNLLEREKYPYLIKCFNDLEIDEDSSLKHIEVDHDQKLKLPELRDRKTKNGKDYEIDPEKQYRYSFTQIKKIIDVNSRTSGFSVDNKIHRFYSCITSLRSDLRGYLTWKGKKLISLDIKNSQPYLSTLFLNKQFYFPLNNNPHNPNIPLNIYNPLFSKTTTTPIPLMLAESARIWSAKSIDEYNRLVKEGILYKYFKDKIEEILGIRMNVKEAKMKFFAIFFSRNRYKNKFKDLFRDIFPEPDLIFSKFKEVDYKALSLWLQTIESYLVLDVICKRMSEEYPEAPLFTIHDSIATIAEYIDQLEKIMNEELTKHIGISPTLKREEWIPPKIPTTEGTLYAKESTMYEYRKAS